MSVPEFHPGQVWQGLNLDARLLLEQWSVELRHKAGGFDGASLAFHEADWAALDWNAREALHLNVKWRRMPRWWRHCFLAQDGINFHLMHALGKLLEAWRHCVQLPRVRTLHSLPAQTECLYRIEQARGRLEAARAKHASLTGRKQTLRHVSLRQWRLYQNAAQLFTDLAPLVDALDGYLHQAAPGDPAVPQLLADIRWHTVRLQALTGGLERRPGLRDRFKGQRLEVNRVLAASCLYHSNLLKRLVQPCPV